MVKAAFGIRGRTRPIAYAGIDIGGEMVEGPKKMGLRMAATYLKLWDRFPHKRDAWTGLLKMLRRQMT